MRVYLDTNILVFLFQKNGGEISASVQDIITDYANTLVTSSVCVQEFIHLCQIGKVFGDRKKKVVTDANTELPWIEKMGIDIVAVTEKHLHVLSSLPMQSEHRDPNDRLIIAQAISDHTPLISSDQKFSRYIKYGLDFIQNNR